MDGFDDIPSPELDVRPALKAEVLRLIVARHWVTAAQYYRQATGADWAEAQRIVEPLGRAVRARKDAVPIRPDGGTDHTLDSLNEINWWVLDHAYGAATDVPEAIRSLASDDPGRRTRALDDLFGNIAHQGSVYSATAVAVPFLVELVRSPAVPDRAGILGLLDSVAFGQYWALYEEPRQGRQPATSEVGELVHGAVRAGIPAYLDLLDGQQHDLRLAALQVLCRFRGDSPRIVPHIRRLLEMGVDADTYAMLVMSLGYFDIEGTWALDLCDRLLDAERPSLLALAAAIARLRLDAQRPSAPAARILAGAAAHPERYPEPGPLIAGEGFVNQATRPATLLESAHQDDVLVAAPILIEAILEGDGAGRLQHWRFQELARTLIAMLFRNHSLPRAADPPLAAARIAAIRAIVGHRHLATDPRSNVPVSDGFPVLRGLLPGAFLDGALGHDTPAGELTPEQRAVLQALLRDPAWASQSTEVVAVARQLLALFSAPDGWNADLPAAALTPEQRAILEVFANSGYWRRDLSRFSGPSLGEALRAHHLPESPAAVRAYLQRGG